MNFVGSYNKNNKKTYIQCDFTEVLSNQPGFSSKSMALTQTRDFLKVLTINK
jgi:hypothetical protein